MVFYLNLSGPGFGSGLASNHVKGNSYKFLFSFSQDALVITKHVNEHETCKHAWVLLFLNERHVCADFFFLKDWHYAIIVWSLKISLHFQLL